MNKLIGPLILGMFLPGGQLLGAGENPQSSAPVPEVLTVQQAIRMTLARAPEISLAQAQAIRAAEALRETRSLNLPQVVTGSGLAYNNGFPLSIEGSAPSIVQIAMSQSILSKKNKALVHEAEESSKAAQLGSETARNELAARTALVYCELHQSRKAEALWVLRLESARRDQQLVSDLLEAGRARPVDLTLARSTTSQAQQQLLVVREQARLSEAELKDLTGLGADLVVRTTEPQLDSQTLGLPADSLYQKALEVHPEIRQAEANLRAREFRVEAEKSEKYPRLDLISEYALFSRTNNYQDYFNRFSRHNFLFGLSVQYPIFNGFRTEARVAQSRQEAAEAKFKLQRAKADLKLGIERSASALKIARGAADLAQEDVAAARESLKVSESLLEAGRIGVREAASVRNQLREKETALVEVERILQQRQVELLRLVGALAPAN
jgi:outer membrane protein